MKTYIIKVIILFFSTYVLFEFTLAPRIDFYSKKINAIQDQSTRIKIKEKILVEMKEASKKENYFSEDERVIISNFLNKIINELEIKSK